MLDVNEFLKARERGHDFVFFTCLQKKGEMNSNGNIMQAFLIGNNFSDKNCAKF